MTTRGCSRRLAQKNIANSQTARLRHVGQSAGACNHALSGFLLTLAAVNVKVKIEFTKIVEWSPVMAKTAAERKREQLERERKALLDVTDSTYQYLRVPFFSYLESDPNWSTVEMCFELIGYEPPSFDNDLGPEHFANDSAFGSEEDRVEAFQGSAKSIGRAEVLVDHLMSAAVELSGIIANYKMRELRTRLKDLEEAELADHVERKAALQQAAHISRVLEELGKNQRVTLAKYRVKGV